MGRDVVGEGLASGKEVYVVIQATNVLMATELCKGQGIVLGALFLASQQVLQLGVVNERVA